MKLSMRAVALALGGALVALAVSTGAQPVFHRGGNGVNWVSGGVSLEERDEMRAVATGYNLQIVVAMRGSGEYLAQVPIAVEDANGNAVLATVTDGPWLYANVPPGRYRIRIADGHERTVDVGASGSSAVVFHSATE